jgi:drug/metabolite transporter (DMT)-like permease
MIQVLGFIYVLIAGICFGFLGVFGRFAFQHGFSVGELLTYRFALASFLLWMGLLVFKRKLIFLSFKQILISTLLGCFGYALFSTLYFMSIQGISVALAALLLFTFPIFVNIGAHFILKERMGRAQLMSLLLASLGLIILLWGPLFVHSIKSVAYALSAALAYAIYVLLSGRLQKGVEPLSSSLYVISAAAVTLFMWHSPSIIKAFHFSWDEFLIVLGLAVVCTVIPLTLFLSGLQKLSSSKASIVVMIEPVVATLAAWAILGERLSPTQSFGAGLVVLALLFNTKKG